MTVYRILNVKTSSLGDVVHNLPVVADIRLARNDVIVDWVVENSFAAIPALHPGVRRVIPCELRRWRLSWWQRSTRDAWRGFVRDLRRTRYNAILDTQGLLKSALVARLARGPRFGLDWRSSREPLRLFYDRTFNVPWGMHAVERNRRLAGLALGYEPRGAPDFGLRCTPAADSWLPPRPYLVLLHGTSHPAKLWPDSEWIGLGRALNARGFSLVLPSGNAQERERALRIAGVLTGARAAPGLALDALAAVLAGAAGAVGVDTGLTHLAAALGVPVVGVYGATDPRATGVYPSATTRNIGNIGRFPPANEVLEAVLALIDARPVHLSGSPAS